MATDVFTNEQLRHILYQAATRMRGPCRLRPSYVGRFMQYACVGLVLDDVTDLLEFGLRLADVILEATEDRDVARDDIEDLSNALYRMAHDAMGKGEVVYWPDITAEDA